MADHVDLILEQWAQQRPDLDVSPMAITGRLARLKALLDAEQSRTFGAHDLDRASFDVLATLLRSNNEHRLTPNELVRSSMVTSGAVSQRLDRLQARGLITRTPSEVDKRVVHVQLTEAGLKLVDQALPDHVATGRRFLEPLDPERREALADALRTLLEALGDATD